MIEEEDQSQLSGRNGMIKWRWAASILIVAAILISILAISAVNPPHGASDSVTMEYGYAK